MKRLAAIAAALACGIAASPALAAPTTHAAARFVGIHKIRHIVVIMQENRSFDSYFGTYPGADGLPKDVCVPDPKDGGCLRPYHNTRNANGGGPHGDDNSVADVDGGKMDGFVGQAWQGVDLCNTNANDPNCTSLLGAGGKPDVMGYHNGSDIPNYWAYARNFVLQDRMFESVAASSLPAHLFMLSGWSARCEDPSRPETCTTNIHSRGKGPNAHRPGPDYGWTDLTYLLNKHGVSWR